MMDRYRHEELKQVDPLERDWFNFIVSNNVDIEKYEKDFSLFIKDYII
jgi:hypothetical protein